MSKRFFSILCHRVDMLTIRESFVKGAAEAAKCGLPWAESAHI